MLRFQRLTGWIDIAIICALFLVNIAGLGLLLSLKKQLSFNVRRFRITSAPVPTSLWSGSDSATVSIDTPGSGKLPRRSSYMPTGPQSIDTVVTHDLASSKNLKHLILNGIGSRAVRDDARQILSMRKIQWDLTVFQGFVFSLLTAFLGVSIWTGFKATHDTPSWPAREAALLIVPWLYGCGVSVALSLLGYNSLRNPEAAISSVSVGSQRPNSQGSASGESDLAQVEKQDDTPFSNEKQRISFETPNATTNPHRAAYPLLRPNLSRADSQIKIPSTHTDVLVHSSVTCAYEDERVGQPQVRPVLPRSNKCSMNFCRWVQTATFVLRCSESRRCSRASPSPSSLSCPSWRCRCSLLRHSSCRFCSSLASCGSPTRNGGIRSDECNRPGEP